VRWGREAARRGKISALALYSREDKHASGERAQVGDGDTVAARRLGVRTWSGR
jgi:hypothetical protein